MDLPTLKLLAARVRGLLEQSHHRIGHNQALDLIAALPGLRNWPEVNAFPDRVMACQLDEVSAARLGSRLKARFGLDINAYSLLSSLLLPTPSIAEPPERNFGGLSWRRLPLIEYCEGSIGEKGITRFILDGEKPLGAQSDVGAIATAVADVVGYGAPHQLVELATAVDGGFVILESINTLDVDGIYGDVGQRREDALLSMFRYQVCFIADGILGGLEAASYAAELYGLDLLARLTRRYPPTEPWLGIPGTGCTEEEAQWLVNKQVIRWDHSPLEGRDVLVGESLLWVNELGRRHDFCVKWLTSTFGPKAKRAVAAAEKRTGCKMQIHMDRTARRYNLPLASEHEVDSTDQADR